jgi:hypothetical protein
MRQSARIALLTAAFALAAAAPAAARTITVTGKVRGAAKYTVTASSSSGTGRSARLGRKGTFSLKVSGRAVSLSLIRPSGRYYGPVVLDRVAHGRVHLTVKRSIALGEIRLVGSYAVLRTPLARAALGSSWARADRHGKPAGAGRLGARARGAKIRSRAAQQPPGPQPTLELGADPDRDGLTNAYDIDDDNDGVLDVSDPDSGNPNNFPGRVFTNLWADLPDTLNADLGAVTDEAIDATLAKDLTAAFDASPWQVLAGRQLTAVDVNCFTISWCAPGTGTAVIPDFAYGPQGPGPGQPAPGTRFAAFDPNGDGLPNLSPDARHIQQPAFGALVAPGTGRAGLDPAATVNFRFTTDQGPFEYATTMGPSFVTTPAIVSLSGQAISYPVGSADPGVGNGHDIQLASPVVTFSFYRPQRPAIPGAEAPGYYDMGHLRYEVSNPLDGTGAACPASAFSNASPTLTPTSNGPDQGVTDSAGDQPASASNVLTFTLDLAQCTGQSLAGRSLPLGITARTPRGENAGTKLWVHIAG